MKKIIIFSIFFLLILIFFIGFFGLYEVKFLIGRASIKTTVFSVDNSYIFITPLKARANGQEKIRLTVFVLDDRGLGVAGKKVYLESNQALFIDYIQTVTDNLGKAYFDIRSSEKGEYYLKVKIDDIELKQPAHLSFY